MARLDINIGVYTDKTFTEEKLQEIADTLRTQLASFDLDATVEVELETTVTAYAGPPTCDECCEVLEDCTCDDELVYDADEFDDVHDELVCAACQKIHVPFVAPGIGDS
jgi:hypothetical protein